jgi:cellulose synthase/poly-beta-1,6-N-acetylglucosamine synthase-like glycosyltransferase
VVPLSQLLLSSAAPELGNEFSIGVCAADHAAKLKELLDIINQERFPAGFVLKSIIVVGSGLDPEVSAVLRILAQRNDKLILVEEPIRRGKAEAINRILEEYRGDFLVLVNSDAQPERGAIAYLLSTIAGNRNVGMVSASPALENPPGITGAVLRLMWSVHNECLLALNDRGNNNHCCDELIVLRSRAIRKLPRDTVNDGAFLAGSAYREGYSIQFCQGAHVQIDVPRRISDLLKQRRRILYGHAQIVRSVGQTPRTLESMIFISPKLGLSILVRTLARSPRLVLALPVAVVSELISVMGAVFDSVTSTKNHVPWDRVAFRN